MFKKLLAALLLTTTLFAGQTTTTTRRIDQVEGAQNFQNLLQNAQFENGTRFWTATGGALASETTASNVGRGSKSLSFDASASGQYLTSNAVAIPPGLYGKNGQFSCTVKTSATDYKVYVYDGSAQISDAITILGNGAFQDISQNFIFPSSGNISLRFESQSNAAIMYIDDCYIGPALNLSNVSQATFIASGYFATTAGCLWTRTGTTFGAFATVASCPGPTVEANPYGYLQTTDTDLPQFTLNNLPPGRYRVIFEGAPITGPNSHGDLTISDGSTTSGVNGFNPTNYVVSFVEGQFNYTTAGNRTFALWTANNSGEHTLNNQDGKHQLTFYVYKYPTASQTALNADTSSVIWSGYHGSDCSWSRTNTAYGDPTADATCTLTETNNSNFGTVTSYLSGSDKLPGIVFTPKRPGKYQVCAHPKLLIGGTNTTNYDAKLWDGTTTLFEAQIKPGVTASGRHTVAMCGVYDIPSIAQKTISIQLKSSADSFDISADTANRSAIEWTVIALENAFPMPVIVNSVRSPESVSKNLCSARITNAGTAVISRHDNCVSTASRTSTGKVTVTFNTGVFSVAPICTCMVEHQARVCSFASASGDTTTTTANFLTDDNTGTSEDNNFHFICMGTK